MFLVGARKKICTASFLGAQELHSQSTGKANVLIVHSCISLQEKRRKGSLYRVGGSSRRWTGLAHPQPKVTKFPEKS